MPQKSKPNLIVSLDGVDACIEGATILKNVNWHVEQGEHWGIVGPNGSGKSTLISLVAGTLWPAPGSGRRRYYFDSLEYRDAVKARRRITTVGPELQDRYSRFNWNFPALAIVMTGIHRTEIPRLDENEAQRASARELLELVNAAHLADRPFLELSRGEQRRVLIARGLAFNPEILLLDEPASGLDAAAKQSLDVTIESASRQTTIIATAHSCAQLPSITNRFIEINEGRVIVINASGTTAGRHSEKPSSAFAANRAARAGPAARKHTRTRTATDTTPRDTALIRLINANIWLNEAHVLKNINWALEPGQHWLVTGANGAGKSTFLRLLHGQLRPARGGRINWPGLGNPRNIWELRAAIAWVSPELQATYRYPTTVYQCIASGFTSSIGQTRRLTPAQRDRGTALLAQFELEALRNRPLSKLSYGQARRALLARTLASKPRILLLDEPWEGLDADTISLVCGRLKELMHGGLQIVCATHIGDMGLGIGGQITISNGTIDVGDVA